MKGTTRRGAITKFATGFLGLFALTTRTASAKPMRARKQARLKWIKLTDDPLQPDDFWASTDPNNQDSHYLLSPVTKRMYGKPASSIGRCSGDFWRPVTFVRIG